ncbi:hypothetical protein Dip510_001525 [Elusimicrobium posterum]|uniref:hypothetical protein n=1 Tax=Elusimicrobium posterum TaxID=3116653 RepID=UPI003C758608
MKNMKRALPLIALAGTFCLGACTATMGGYAGGRPVYRETHSTVFVNNTPKRPSNNVILVASSKTNKDKQFHASQPSKPSFNNNRPGGNKGAGGHKEIGKGNNNSHHKDNNINKGREDNKTRPDNNKGGFSPSQQGGKSENKNSVNKPQGQGGNKTPQGSQPSKSGNKR